MSGLFANLAVAAKEAGTLGIEGRIRQVVGLSIIADHMSVPVGSVCTISARATGHIVRAEVVGFRGDETLLMTLGEMDGISRGDTVKLAVRRQTTAVGPQLLGRVLNGLGEPIDDKGPVLCTDRRPIESRAVSALKRQRITQPISTGIRAIDSCLTCGRGQRLGLFAGAGVGKSVLLGMMARYTSAHVNVICLVGERGREVREFIERDLGESGLRRSVVVVSTNDEPPLLKIKAALLAHTIAEEFRDRGRDVLLMLDSTTRLAAAQRQVGLSAGEPPTTKGYPPSVFSMLPRILERSGCGETGSITGFYTILVDGDDMNDPVADAVRGILDGHFILSRRLAGRGQYPAIDLTQSISRLMNDIIDERSRQMANQVRMLLSAYDEVEDLVNIGAYARGANVDVDLAVTMHSEILSFLQQEIEQGFSAEQSSQAIEQLTQKINRQRQALEAQRKTQATATAGATMNAGAPAAR